MLVTPLLKLAADRQASDLFFSAGAPVNVKIEGITTPVNAQILTAEVIKHIAYEMMNSRQIVEFESNKIERLESQISHKLGFEIKAHRLQINASCEEMKKLGACSKRKVC